MEKNSFDESIAIYHVPAPLEKAMAAHSSTLAWKIAWTEEPGRLQSMGSQRVRHDRATSLSLSYFPFPHRKRPIGREELKSYGK